MAHLRSKSNVIDDSFPVPKFLETNGTKSSRNEGAPYVLAFVLLESVETHSLERIELSVTQITNMFYIDSRSHLHISGLLDHICERGSTELINVLGKLLGIVSNNVPPPVEAARR